MYKYISSKKRLLVWWSILYLDDLPRTTFRLSHAVENVFSIKVVFLLTRVLFSNLQS